MGVSRWQKGASNRQTSLTTVAYRRSKPHGWTKIKKERQTNGRVGQPNGIVGTVAVAVAAAVDAVPRRRRGVWRENDRVRHLLPPAPSAHAFVSSEESAQISPNVTHLPPRHCLFQQRRWDPLGNPPTMFTLDVF